MLVDDQNPLTSQTLVNRVWGSYWKRFQVGNLLNDSGGSQATLLTHPEFDWIIVLGRRCHEYDLECKSTSQRKS